LNIYDPQDWHSFIDWDDDSEINDIFKRELIEYFGKGKEDQPYLPFYNMYAYDFEMNFEYSDNGEISKKTISFKGYNEKGDLLYQFDGEYEYDQNGELVNKVEEKIGEEYQYGYVIYKDFALEQGDVEFHVAGEAKTIEADDAEAAVQAEASVEEEDVSMDAVLQALDEQQLSKKQRILRAAQLAERDRILNVYKQIAENQKVHMEGLKDDSVNKVIDQLQK